MMTSLVATNWSQKMFPTSSRFPAAPPALAHALLASLDIIDGAEGRSRRAHLDALVRRFDASLVLRRWRRLPSATPIQPVIIGENQAALAAAAALDARGLWVPAIRPPTVPLGTARLRVTLSAAHGFDDLARLIEALQTLDNSLDNSRDNPTPPGAPT